MSAPECLCPKLIRSRCIQCWRPAGTHGRDTLDLVDLSSKFGFVPAAAAVYWDAVGSVLPIRPLSEIVIHYLTVQSYEIFDKVDAIDAYALIYPAIILDKWTIDSQKATWYLLRFFEFTYCEDLLVQQDAIAPRSSRSSIGPHRSVVNDSAENDPRWAVFAHRPFNLVRPFFKESDPLAAFERGMHRLKIAEWRL
jgi:hypothetical protein